MELHLMRPEWLWSLVPAALLALLLWRQRRQRGNWSSVIAPQLLRHLVGENAAGATRNYLPLVLFAWCLAAFAASGPSWEKIPQPVHQKQDALVLLLDLSYSMKSADLAPSRMDRARQKLMDLLQERREGQTGLVAYAGDAHIVTPLTDDIPTIANLLPALHPDMMPVPGSNPLSAVTMGLDLLRSAGIQGGSLLLVTDGIDKDQAAELSRAVRAAGARLHVMGVGTRTGAPIPLPRGGFVKDAQGTIVMPGLDEAALRKLAADSRGLYRAMRIDNGDLQAIADAEQSFTDSEQTLALDRTADAWDDKGYLFILTLLPFVLSLFRRGWLLGLLPLILLAPTESTYAQNWDDLWLTPDQQGQRALQSGDNTGAAQLFENPDWAGTAAYRDGDYEQAVEHFNHDDSPDSLYNRGNALAHSGDLDGAIAAYEQSLALDPAQEDAQANLDLLRQIKEQQEQQQQEGDSEQSDGGEQGQQEQDGQQQEQDGQQENGQQQQGEEQQGQQQSEQQQDGQQSQGQQNPETEDETQQQREGQQANEEQTDERSQEQQEMAEQQAEEGEAWDEQAPQQARAEQPSPEELERQQAMEQWLRRVPDDPSGLLREKFRYESRLREQEGKRRDNESYW